MFCSIGTCGTGVLVHTRSWGGTGVFLQWALTQHMMAVNLLCVVDMIPENALEEMTKNMDPNRVIMERKEVQYK